jgi:3-oxoacyl-[acyl-carrier protein] reductase
MTAHKVALALVAGLKRGREEIHVGWQSYLALLCQRFAPWLLELILGIAAPMPRKRSKFVWLFRG